MVRYREKKIIKLNETYRESMLLNYRERHEEYWENQRKNKKNKGVQNGENSKREKHKSGDT